ncbi:MAG: ferrous iron transport protein A [gamma proteobacterium symbiont of Bathyaustriella thionipta]|nr:ferrous iron transport protein A [gamma proteobacterium symbiont of Bathyaustriella thionipta]
MTKSFLLHECSIGQSCRIVAIDGPRRLQHRLLSLGLRIGSEVSVVQQRGKDVVVMNTGNRIALGETIAHHLRVEALH